MWGIRVESEYPPPTPTPTLSTTPLRMLQPTSAKVSRPSVATETIWWSTCRLLTLLACETFSEWPLSGRSLPRPWKLEIRLAVGCRARTAFLLLFWDAEAGGASRSLSSCCGTEKKMEDAMRFWDAFAVADHDILEREPWFPPHTRDHNAAYIFPVLRPPQGECYRLLWTLGRAQMFCRVGSPLAHS